MSEKSFIPIEEVENVILTDPAFIPFIKYAAYLYHEYASLVIAKELRKGQNAQAGEVA